MGALNWMLWIAGYLAASPLAAEQYRQATTDADGGVQLITTDGQRRRIPPEAALPEIGAPVGVKQIRIAPDRRAVGWLVEYPNCCTSDPIPLTLVVHSDGTKRAYRGSGVPIWQWRFLADGQHVAFRQETVHGGTGLRFELHEVRSGKLLDAHDGPVGPDNQPLADADLPDWAAAIGVEVPTAFLGRWDTQPPPCADFDTEGMLQITERTAALYAGGGPIRAVQSDAADQLALQVTLHLEDGQQRVEWLQLRLSADGQRLQREGMAGEYFRCQAR
ncbi:MAG: hypothetical protein MUE46_05450 [Xanthomonadales bacterium]|jgi:hypothetical protein|nr:hypothetical protein [Xanthomonadales bacterium]